MAPERIKPNSDRVRFPRWQPEFEAALLEADSEQLPRRMEAAEAAIFLRLQELVNTSDSHAERQAISDAVRTLRILQTERLHYPLWNKK
jgi:hypothetical protein